MVDNDADYVCVSFDRIDEDGKRFSFDQSVPELTVIDVSEDNISRFAFLSTAPWGKLFKRSLLSGCSFPEYPIPIHEDCIFILSVYPKVKRYVMLPDVLYHYLVYDEQSTQTSTSTEKTDKFRSFMVDLKNSFEADGVSEPYLKMLDLAAFIHVGIADAHRTADIRGMSLRKYCAGAKAFFSENFPGWRKIKLRPYGSFTFRCFMVWSAKIMYKLCVFWIFIKLYNLMIKVFHVDVKW